MANIWLFKTLFSVNVSIFLSFNSVSYSKGIAGSSFLNKKQMMANCGPSSTLISISYGLWGSNGFYIFKWLKFSKEENILWYMKIIGNSNFSDHGHKLIGRQPCPFIHSEKLNSGERVCEYCGTLLTSNHCLILCNYGNTVVTWNHNKFHILVQHMYFLLLVHAYNVNPSE